MPNTINTNISAYYAQANISTASNMASASVSRLSSGNRIVKASDDVAALSTGTSLRTQVTALRTALTNASQGTSLLQVADGALSQVTEILQRQKAIALQAGSGSLTDTDRGYLDQEFQALSTEIDRLTGATNFNGVTLLNGSLSTSSTVTTKTTASTKASASISFNDSLTNGETITIAGLTFTAATTPASATQFAIGTPSESVNNLATLLNNLAETGTADQRARLGVATYSAAGTVLTITARTGGSLGNNFVIDTSGTGMVYDEAGISGAYQGSSFNLFTTATAVNFTSATQIVTSDTAAAATPFQNADSITATINGSTKTLMTLTDGAGTGSGGEYTLQDIVNGINNNADTTGIKASLVYNQSSSSYNIRLNYDNLNNNIIIDAGTNFHSGTYRLNGTELTNATNNLVDTAAAGAGTLTKAIFYSNYVNVLTGNTVTAAAITTTVTAATPASAATPFRIGDNLTFTRNGTETILHTFATNDGLDDIVDSINGKTAQTGVYAAVTGTGGGYGLRLYFNDPNSGYTAINAGTGLSTVTLNTTSATTGAAVTQTTKAGLSGGADNGLGLGGTTATGTIGDSILTDLSQSKAQISVLLTQNAVAGNTLVVGGTTFTFTSNTNRAANEILIGSSLTESIDNAIATLSNYQTSGAAIGNTAYQMNQMEFTRNGNSLVVSSKDMANVYQNDGTTVSQVTTTITGASTTNSGNLNNAATASGSAYGVNTAGVTNADFQGVISGFTATYKSTDTVDLSVKVGNYTYTAKDVDMTVASDTAVRFYSDTLGDGTSGGYFDVQLQGNQVSTFSTQSSADVIASRFDAAFSSLSFIQERNLSSYNGTQSITSGGSVIGSLLGSKVSAQLSSFDSVKLSDVKVSAPSGSNTDAKITLTINGVNYSTATSLGSKLGAYQTYRLTSELDPNQYVDFTTGSSTIQLDTSAKALAVENALKNAFGATSGSAALNFQIGAASTDVLSVSIGSAKTSALFDGKSLNVLTQEAATTASDQLDKALQTVTTLRASVGALQSRFNYAAANIQIAVQNQDAARSALLDTDVAAESTAYATSQVKLQAGISVLAQANQQLQNLLKLIQ